MNSNERFFYIGDIAVYTFNQNFRGKEPTLEKILEALHDRLKAKTISSFTISSLTISIKDIVINKGKSAVIFLHGSDPTVNDPAYLDISSRVVSHYKRAANQVPVFSMHVVVNLNNKHDTGRLYPAAIENVDHFPRSAFINFMRMLLKSIYETEQPTGKKGQVKIFYPVIGFIAQKSSTLDSALRDGGRLLGINWVSQRVKESAWGDKAYPVLEDQDMKLTVKNKPTGSFAHDIINNVWGSIEGGDVKNLKVRIQEVDGNSKTVSIDLKRNNILSNMFIRQKLYDKISPDMLVCEDVVRNDVVQRVLRSLN